MASTPLDESRGTYVPSPPAKSPTMENGIHTKTETHDFQKVTKETYRKNKPSRYERFSVEDIERLAKRCANQATAYRQLQTAYCEKLRLLENKQDLIDEMKLAYKEGDLNYIADILKR